MKSALGSTIIAGIAPDLNIDGNVIPVPIIADDSFDPPRLVLEIPDRALRDLGIVTIDGSAMQDCGSVYLAGVEYQVKNAEINATSGDTTVVSIVATKKIRVLSLVFTLSAATTVGWNSDTNVKINPMSFSANGGMTFHPTAGYFTETNAGEALVISLGGSSNVRGSLNYIEV